MREFKQHLFEIIVLIMLTACDGDTVSEIQTYNQSIVLPPEATEQVVILDNINSSITTIENSVTWLKVGIENYTSGPTSIKVTTINNIERTERKCYVIITVSSGNKVILSITQQGLKEEIGIDDSHDRQTDKPAYIPILKADD